MRPGRTFQALAALSAAVLMSALAPASAAPTAGIPARVAGESVADYMVVFKDGTNARAQAALLGQAGARIEHVFESVFSGVGASLTDRQVRTLRAMPFVRWVEADSLMYASGTQSDATWGLARIDQRTLPLGTSYTWGTDGAGVDAYIVDTGIRATHTEFGSPSRVDTARGITKILDGRGTDDCNGHGTHVAATVGGSTYGVAKNVTLIPVRVLSCRGSGSTLSIAAALDDIASAHAASQRAVANMSLGGGASDTLDTAVNGLINDGVVVVVAAGNDGKDAANYSPARVAAAVTVGATTNEDVRASFSNIGAGVDVFAPGVNITSAWYSGDTALNTISGTSMASPHVAGVAALLLAKGRTASQTVSDIVSQSTPDSIINLPSGTPNRLLYVDPVDVTASAYTVAAPLAPSIVSTSSTKVSASVTWAPGNYPVLTYTIQVRQNGALLGTFERLGNATSITVSGLKSRVTYDFTIIASNTRGNASISTSVTTK